MDFYNKYIKYKNKYYDLSNQLNIIGGQKKRSRKLFKKLLVNLTPYMDYVDRPDPDEPTKTIRGVHDKWMATGLFRESAKVPDSDTQGLGGLSDLLVEWANNGKVFDPQTVDQIPSKSKGLI